MSVNLLLVSLKSHYGCDHRKEERCGPTKIKRNGAEGRRNCRIDFVNRALWPRAKHKEEIAPEVAYFYGVSTRYVDTVLRALDPARRKEMKALAAATAKRWAEFRSTPRGIEMMAEHAEIKRKLQAKRSASHTSSKRG